MDWESLGGFVKDVGGAVSQNVNAFKSDEPADRKEAKAAGMMNWQTIGLALGGVLVVALILKFAFRK
jgi:hypothetical protein